MFGWLDRTIRRGSVAAASIGSPTAADLGEVRIYGIRHWTEQGYDQVKDELGWADFRQRPRPPAALINPVTLAPACTLTSRINKTAASGGSSRARPSARRRATNHPQTHSETCSERSARPCHRMRPERPL